MLLSNSKSENPALPPGFMLKIRKSGSFLVDRIETPHSGDRNALPEADVRVVDPAFRAAAKNETDSERYHDKCDHKTELDASRRRLTHEVHGYLPEIVQSRRL
jgi:hypothetical protein